MPKRALKAQYHKGQWSKKHDNFLPPNLWQRESGTTKKGDGDWPRE